jgi:8-oxo-dGTP pyrophosphatase MutT (NUDIX family)
VRVVAPPPLAAPLEREVARERARLAAHPHRFDGPLLGVLAVEGTTILAYVSTFALERARVALGEGLGTLGVRLLLDDGRGRVLWQLRGPAALHPGTWSMSAAGTVPPSADLAQTIASEASEELDLRPGALEELRPLAVAAGGDVEGAQVVYRARLRAGWRAHPREPEVAALRWSRSAAGFGPLEPQTAAVLGALQRAGIDR